MSRILNELTLRLDSRADEALYEQLARHIAGEIMAGRLQAQERLPSKRALSAHLRLSRSTVETAYAQLVAEGYITSRERSGYFVASYSPPLGESPLPPSSQMGLHKEASPLYDFSTSAVDTDIFPYRSWIGLFRETLYAQPELLRRGPGLGEPELREALSTFLYQYRNVRCEPGRIVIGAGIEALLFNLMLLLPRAEMAVEDPGYQGLRRMAKHLDFPLLPIPVDSQGMDLEALRQSGARYAYVTPSHQFPMGSAMPIGRRAELIRWAQEAGGRYIIEDDYDSELRYFGKPIPALKSLGGSDRVIYLGSFSSTLFAALKISYMVLPSRMAQVFSSIAGDYSPTCSKLEQLTLAMFMESGLYQTHIKKLRKLYSQKLLKITEAFDAKASDFVRVISSSSGISIILEIDSPKTPGQIKRDAEALGIPAACVGRRIILYYNQIPLSEIDGAVSQLADVWRQ